MNTPVPSWRELWQRIALLIIVEARAIRRRYRHWRVLRRTRVVRIAPLTTVAQQFLRSEPGQVILLNGERPGQFTFRQPDPGSMIPGHQRSANYKAALDRLAASRRPDVGADGTVWASDLPISRARLRQAAERLNVEKMNEANDAALAAARRIAGQSDG